MSNKLYRGHWMARYPTPYNKAFDPNCGCQPRILTPPQGFHAMTTGQVHGDYVEKAHKRFGEHRISGLNPAKYTQRRQMVNDLPRGTILHLFAGNGNLARAVYKHRGDEHVLVDKRVNPRLRNLLPNTQIYEKSMEKFLDEDLPNIRGRITLVDIDPFGTPAPAIKAFFRNHKITEPTRFAITDGYAMFLGLGKNTPLGQQSTMRHYMTTHVGDGSRANQLRLLDNLMTRMASQYNLKLRRVNALNKQDRNSKVIYVGYVVSPVS
jgi:hypothetical protein